VKPFIILLLLALLSACSGMGTKAFLVEVGSSKEDVLKVMGNSPYPDSKDGVIAWRYGSKVGLRYCDYREIFIFRDKVIHINQYYHASVAGCFTGLQKIDWGPILLKVDELNRQESEKP
jgi:hypothetical protein